MDFWFAQDVGNDPDVEQALESNEAYVPSFSARAIPSLGPQFWTDPQELDVLAPGLYVVAPGDHGPMAGLFFWGGTSFASPHVAGIAALMLEKKASLQQSDVEAFLRSTALPMPTTGSRTGVLDPLMFNAVYDPAWDDACGSLTCDPIGAGLVQVDAALQAIR